MSTLDLRPGTRTAPSGVRVRFVDVVGATDADFDRLYGGLDLDLTVIRTDDGVRIEWSENSTLSTAALLDLPDTIRTLLSPPKAPTMKNKLILAASIAVAALLATTVISAAAVSSTVTAQADRVISATATHERLHTEAPNGTSWFTATAGEGDILAIKFKSFPVSYDLVQVTHTATETGGFRTMVDDDGVHILVEEGTPVGAYQVVLTVAPSEVETPLIFWVEVVA